MREFSSLSMESNSVSGSMGGFPTLVYTTSGEDRDVGLWHEGIAKSHELRRGNCNGKYERPRLDKLRQTHTVPVRRFLVIFHWVFAYRGTYVKDKIIVSLCPGQVDQSFAIAKRNESLRLYSPEFLSRANENL